MSMGKEIQRIFLSPVGKRNQHDYPKNIIKFPTLPIGKRNQIF